MVSKQTPKSNIKKSRLRELQSLIGILNFACSVVPPGRAFLRRLIDLTIGLSKPHHHRRLNKETRLDIQAWLIFVESFNGKCLFLSDRWGTSEQLTIGKNSQIVIWYFNQSVGHLIANQCFRNRPPNPILLASVYKFNCSDVPHLSDKNRHFPLKLSTPIAVAIQLWGNASSNKCVTFFTDNSVVVHLINKQSSKDPTIMTLVRKFVVLTLQFHILFKAVHIPV
jgi:hypothetical protein